jgi:hypothetical protein
MNKNGHCRKYWKKLKMTRNWQNRFNNKSVQLFINLHAYSAAQRQIIEQGRTKKANKGNTYTNRRGRRRQLVSYSECKNSINAITLIFMHARAHTRARTHREFLLQRSVLICIHLSLNELHFCCNEQYTFLS